MQIQKPTDRCARQLKTVDPHESAIRRPRTTPPINTSAPPTLNLLFLFSPLVFIPLLAFSETLESTRPRAETSSERGSARSECLRFGFRVSQILVVPTVEGEDVEVFSFPPPELTKKHDPLIESSIKLHKEKDRTEKKKKKERKDKCIDGTLTIKDKNSAHKRRRREERNKMEFKGAFHSKAKEEETEQLERSSLTEEHGMPCALYLCDSPDSSQNSKKKIKLGSIDSTVNVHGNKLRIRFHSLKPSETEQCSLAKQSSPAERLNLSLSKQKPAVRPVATEVSCLPLHDQRYDEQSYLPLLKLNEAVSITLDEESCFSGRMDKTLPCGYNGSSKSRRKEAKFKDLIVNWQSLLLRVDQVLDDEWLFGSQRQQAATDVRRGCIEDVHLEHKSSDLCSWPPRACQISGTDIYALPFVLPF